MATENEIDRRTREIQDAMYRGIERGAEIMKKTFTIADQKQLDDYMYEMIAMAYYLVHASELGGKDTFVFALRDSVKQIVDEMVRGGDVHLRD